MGASELASVAAALRREGYESRNLGQVGITVWKDGCGIYLSAQEIHRLNGNVSREVALLLNGTETARPADQS